MGLPGASYSHNRILGAMINATSVCVCGHEKPPNIQWCHECWDKLSTIKAANYSLAARNLAKRIKGCNDVLEQMNKREHLRLTENE